MRERERKTVTKTTQKPRQVKPKPPTREEHERAFWDNQRVALQELAEHRRELQREQREVELEMTSWRLLGLKWRYGDPLWRERRYRQYLADSGF